MEIQTRVDIESDVNLKHTTWRWWDPVEMELPKQIVVLGHRTLLLEDLNESTKLVACVRREFPNISDHSTHFWAYTQCAGAPTHRLSNNLTHSPSDCKRNSGHSWRG